MKRLGRCLATSFAVVVMGLVVIELALRMSGVAITWWRDLEHRWKLLEPSGSVILCLGESTTAMGGEDSYPDQLQEILNVNSSGPEFAVINGGVPGTNTTVIVEQLEDNLERYRPDIVVAMMGGNDPHGALPPNWGRLYQADGFWDNLRIYRLARLVWGEFKNNHTDGQNRQPPAPGELHHAGTIPDRMPYTHPEFGRDYLVFGLSPHGGGTGDEFRIGLAESLERLNYAQVARELLESSADNGHNGVVHLALGMHYVRQGDAGRAERHLRKAAKAMPGDRRPWLQMGFLLLAGGRDNDGFLALEEAVARDREDFLIRPHIALEYERRGRLEGAERHYRAAFEQTGGAYRTFEILVDFYLRNDNLEKVQETVSAMAEEELSGVVYGRLARLFQKLGKEQEAQLYAEKSRRYHVTNMLERTRNNYRRMARILRDRDIPLVAVQYPTRSVKPLEALFAGRRNVHLVDNEETFQAALEEHGYAELFWDHCFGDFGHATRKGNRILAQNIARTLLELTAQGSAKE